MKKKKVVTQLDYHEGLSANQTNIILEESGLDRARFYAWIDGQTCPAIPRYDQDGKVAFVGGVYEHDLFRWIGGQKCGTPLIFD